MKKQNRTIDFQFPTWKGTVGHDYKSQEVIENEGKIYLDLEFVNNMLEGKDIKFVLFPIMDESQMTLMLKKLTEDR